jgi:heme/copper-type cytochrome/quinol oxidase subunit 3
VRASNKYNTTQQPFHIVDPSGWPVMTSLVIFSLFSMLLLVLQKIKLDIIILSCIFIYSYTLMFNWFINIVEENVIGHHTKRIERHFYIAIILFIASEIMFFFSFFWALFHFSLSYNIALITWPPLGLLVISLFNEYNLPTGLPCLNTVILLLSGFTVTISHRYILIGQIGDFLFWLLITVILGLLFTICQGVEYYFTTFSIQDTTYGSIFYLATGFHGFHVIIGTFLLLSCFFKGTYIGYTSTNHFSFEAATWYWHFVDVIWLYLFILLYYWAS